MTHLDSVFDIFYMRSIKLLHPMSVCYLRGFSLLLKLKFSVLFHLQM